MVKKNIQKATFFFSITIFIISLTLNGFCTTVKPCGIAFMNLLTGWLGIGLMHFPSFVWFANPILLFSWVSLYKRTKLSFLLSSISFLIMLSFLFVDEIIVGESGIPFRIVSLGFGYWLWVLSAFIMVVGNIILYFLNKKRLRKNKKTNKG